MSEVLSDREAVIFYAEQRGYASAMEAERKLHEARIKAQAAEIKRLRGDLAKAVELLGQWRLASAGHVSVRSVIDKHDATLAELKGAKP